MKHITFILTVLFWTTAPLVAQTTQPSCPNRGADPSTFCPYGSVWSEKDKKCVGMA